MPENRDAHDAVREKYRAVAEMAEGQFSYPVGRESAVGLGYDQKLLDAAPAEAVSRFVGLGNPLRLHRPRPDERVLDVGCGCGLDVCFAAEAVGEHGLAVGIDLTREMVATVARSARFPAAARLACGDAAALPFAAASFDLVISNGVLNLTPDKDAALGEIHRVLRPGGVLAAADVVVIETLPEEVLADMDAWST